jgi:hypothetical protein
MATEGRSERGVRLPAAHEAPDSSHQLLGLRAALLLLRTHHTVLGVVVQQAKRNLVQGRLDSGYLSENVDAIPVVVDHALDPTNLAFDAAKTLEQLVLRGCISADGSRGRAHVQERSIYPQGVPGIVKA